VWQWGQAKSSRSSTSERGKCSCVPLPEGSGPFIAGRRLDNYKLIISISTMRFTWPVSSALRWSVHRGRFEASMVFRPVLESSRPSLSLSLRVRTRACVCVCSLGSLIVRWTMPRSVLGEIASWCLGSVVTPPHVGWWGGWASLSPAPAYDT
jgi:hypothetical protein